MSSFWTPQGEHQVTPDRPTPQAAPADEPGGRAEPDPAQIAEMEAELRQAQEQLLQVPAAQVVTNHLIGLYELAAIHLRAEPPNLDEARLPIDAMGLIVDNLGDQLPDGPTLAAALQQIRMAYVDLHGQVAGQDDAE